MHTSMWAGRNCCCLCSFVLGKLSTWPQLQLQWSTTASAAQELTHIYIYRYIQSGFGFYLCVEYEICFKNTFSLSLINLRKILFLHSYVAHMYTLMYLLYWLISVTVYSISHMINQLRAVASPLGGCVALKIMGGLAQQQPLFCVLQKTFSFSIFTHH